ncbi:MAG: BolA family protein [Gammaproteobacteria bacterium]|jgi:BolA protein|nr:BolA family protein [Gammaproteobacteria bacterium]
MISQITELLRSSLSPSQLNIIDESSKHKGHAGSSGGGHFIIEISSSNFNGKSQLECHRLVYQALESLIQSKQIHALSIRAKAVY